MPSFTILVPLLLFSLAVAQNLVSRDTLLHAGGSRGNATSPLQYGIMFEVWQLE